MKFEEAAKRVHLGRSILFTGAGFSHGATSISGKALMDANGLAVELSGRLEESSLPLDLATDQFLEKFGPKDLVQGLQALFTVKDYKDHHRHLSRMPWRRIYTTNYDNLFEECRRADKATPVSLTLSDEPAASLEVGAIVHLNGFAERLSPSYWDPDIVLTTTDYLTDKVRGSPWADVLRSDLSMSDSIIFLGYSLYDIDIGRILFENPDLIKKTFFVVGKRADRPTVLKTGRLGTTLAKDVGDVSDLFPEPGSSEAPVAAPFPVTLSRADFTPAIAAPRADDVISFLTKGDLDEGFLTQSVLDAKSKYYIPRSEIGRIIDEIENGHRIVLIHSDLGNGKSLACLEACVLLSVAGYQVFIFGGSTDGFQNDFDYLQSLGAEARSRVAILIEDALSFADIVKVLMTNFPELTIIGTARSAALTTRLETVDEVFGGDHISFELNDLSDEEAKELDHLLLSHGLWADKQGWRDDRRMRFIMDDCKAHLSTVLLSVCKSSLVIGRLADLLAQISNYKDPAFDSLIAVLLMAYAGQPTTIARICDIVEADLFKTGRAQNNEILNEFVHFEKNKVAVRSPIFAQAVLSELIPDNILVEKIPQTIYRLEQLAGHDDFYKPAIRKLMRFGGIERILGRQDKEQKLVTFYENLRATGVVSQNPQFWLQYAIARMSFKDYEGADRNFDAAFGLVRGRSYDPYQIENQFARFLLESRTETQLWTDYFEAFEKAHEIVKAQMRRIDEGDYPYNVAGKYLPMVEARHKEFDQQQLDRIVEWCDDLLEIATAAPASIKRRGYWKNFNIAMKAVKDIVREVR